MNANNNKQQRQSDPNNETIDTKTVYGPPYEVTNYYSFFTTNPNVDSCKKRSRKRITQEN